MDIEKFTERARGFLQAAQTIAIREFHQQITPQHLLKALLDDEEGAAAGLIKTAGGDPKAALTAVETDLARQPKVQGSGAGQPQITPELVRVLDAAQQAATKAGDEYVAQDRLLVAIAASDTPAGTRACAVPASTAGAGEGDQRHPQGPQGHQPERRVQLRRAEEIRPRPDRARRARASSIR